MPSLNLRKGLAFVLAGFLILLFNTLPLQAADPSAKSEAKGVGKMTAPGVQRRGIVGIATYYASKYNGRKTASGERYRPDKMTAAHPNFPLGTVVRVVSLADEKEVVVRINDRCRQKKHPTIDLSLAAAKELGFLNRGIMHVTMQALEEDHPM